MPILSQTIANLINGVSQQPAAARLPSQCDLQENFYSSVEHGLSRRPPTDVATAIASADNTALIHYMDFGDKGRYFAAVSSGVITVADAETGVAQTVIVGAGGADYLTLADFTTSPGAFCGANFSDYALILNREMEVATTAITPRNPQNVKFIVDVRQGNYSTDYKIDITRRVISPPSTTTGTALYTTSATLASDISTTVIATALKADLDVPGSPAHNLITQFEHVLHFNFTDGSANIVYQVQVSDSAGSQYMFVTGDTVQRLTDLPVYGSETAFQAVKILGEDAATPYYVTFRRFDSDTTSVLSRGAWVETKGDSVAADAGLDPTTMPFKLAYVSPGQFTFEQADWTDRTVGDGTSDRTPHFSGKTINDMFVYKNRLGFLSGNSVSFSRHGYPLTFFRTTTVALLDTDAISIEVTHEKASNLKRAATYQNSLVVFSDSAQFTMADDDLLTPKSAGLVQVSGYETDNAVRPIAVGSSLFFTSDLDGFTQVREFSGGIVGDSSYGLGAEAPPVTSHVPSYIEGQLRWWAGSSVDNIIVANVDGGSELYVYKYHWIGDQKVQSCWSKWKFDTGNLILGGWFIGSDLYLVITNVEPFVVSGVHFEGSFILRMPLGHVAQVDEDGDTIAVEMLLDERRYSADATITYDAVNDVTRYNFGVGNKVKASEHIAVSLDDTGDYTTGTIIPQATRLLAYEIALEGNHGSKSVVFGQPYNSRWRPSTQFPKDSQGNNAQEGRLQLKTWAMKFEATHNFDVSVTPLYRDESVHSWTNPVNGGALVNGIALARGTFRVPVQSKSDQVTIEVSSDSHMPCRFTGAVWEGQHITRR